MRVMGSNRFTSLNKTASHTQLVNNIENKEFAHKAYVIILDCTFETFQIQLFSSERFTKPITWNKTKNCVLSSHMNC